MLQCLQVLSKTGKYGDSMKNDFILCSCWHALTRFLIVLIGADNYEERIEILYSNSKVRESVGKYRRGSLMELLVLCGCFVENFAHFYVKFKAIKDCR